MTTASSTPRRSQAEPLSALLRRRTRAAHAGAEVAFQLDAALADRPAYAALLGRLRGFYRPAEVALQHVACWAELVPPIDVRTRARNGLLENDLQRLGAAEVPGPRQMAPPPLLSLAAALGWLYVLEGSALGGQIIARQARAALGADLPVSFFGSEGRQVGRRWRELQQALDVFGATAGPVEVEEAVDAATDSFQQFAQWIGGGATRS